MRDILCLPAGTEPWHARSKPRDGPFSVILGVTLGVLEVRELVIAVVGAGVLIALGLLGVRHDDLWAPGASAQDLGATQVVFSDHASRRPN